MRRFLSQLFFTSLVIIGAPIAHAAETKLNFSSTSETPYEILQEALIDASTGDTLVLPSGRFVFADGLSLDVDGVTIRGAGAEETILSFKGQASGSEGLLVTSDRIILEDFAIEDAKGDGIKSNGSDEITFRNLRVEWTDGPDPTNGAYGLYPVSSTHVLIDNCVAIGASDAGIYVGQSQHIVVRNSRAEYNVAGIEIENSYYADVYDNVATHNTGGILVFDLPGLPQQGGHSVRVYNNKVFDNDTENFAPEGNIVGGVAKGTGIMVMANRDVEIFDNEIYGNAMTAVLIAAYLDDFDDDNYRPFPAGIYVHGNRIGANGFEPTGEIGDLIAGVAGAPIPDIVWDGRKPFWRSVFGVREGDGIYIDDNIATDGGGTADFVDLNATMYFAFRPLHSVDRETPDHPGAPADLSPVRLAQQSGS
jgi:parallel beta-helix repeat protein